MGDVLKVAACGLALTVPAFAATVKVDLGEEHQVIRGFGGMVHNTWQSGNGLSDADAKIAFGTGDGTIGLNTLRIPVNKNSNDFGKELAAAKAAKKYAGDDFILYATPWDSPYAGGNSHINSGNYQKYTDHLNSFAEYMKNQGVPLYAISFQNEPDWCGEWTCWSADEIYNYTKNFADQLRKHGTKVISAESFRYDKNLYNKVLNDANVLKNWDILGAHFYASDRGTQDNFFQYSLADQKNVERWMTEHYTESQGSGNDWRVIRNTGDQANANKRDTVNAMDLAYELFRGLALGNFSQYTWWYIRRCYGLIMERDFGNKLSVPQGDIGKISKRGYVMSQYARFIRPGAIRVGATAKPEANLFASAYKSAGGDSVIVVLVNRDYKNDKTVTVSVPGVAKLESFHVYTTSETKNAKYEGEIEVKDGSVTVKMESGGSTYKDCIVTLVGEIGEVVKVPREPFGGKAVEIPGKIEAENFDVPGSGKENKTYSENDADDRGAEGNGGKSHREGTGVDIYKKATGYVVGYNEEGEWLEYSVNVKEAGKYHLYASVASANETSSFQMSLDGKDITEVISVPKNEGEDNYDDYSNVRAIVELPTGEHILRFTVTGSWMDIDYFNFVLREDDIDCFVNCTEFVKPAVSLATEAENYRIFDMNGGYLGMVRAAGMQELRSNAKALVKHGGMFIAKTTAGKTLRFKIAK